MNSNSGQTYDEIYAELKKQFPSIYSIYWQPGGRQVVVWFLGKEDMAAREQIENFLKGKASNPIQVIIYFHEKRLSKEEVRAMILGVIGVTVNK